METGLKTSAWCKWNTVFQAAFDILTSRTPAKSGKAPTSGRTGPKEWRGQSGTRAQLQHNRSAILVNQNRRGVQPPIREPRAESFSGHRVTFPPKSPQELTSPRRLAWANSIHIFIYRIHTIIPEKTVTSSASEAEQSVYSKSRRLSVRGIEKLETHRKTHQEGRTTKKLKLDKHVSLSSVESCMHDCNSKIEKKNLCFSLNWDSRPI